MATSPSDLIDGYSYVAAGGTVSANSIVIDIASLPGITPAIAHATTGDGRKVVAAVEKNITDKYAGLTVKPTKLTVTAQGNTTNGQHRDVYTIAVIKEVTIGDVAAEPA